MNYSGLLNASVTLSDPKKVAVAYTTALDPDSVGSHFPSDFNLSEITARTMGQDVALIDEHRAQLEKLLHRKLVLLHQVHSHTVIDLDQAGLNQEHTDADGMVTTRDDVALAIFTGDCTPLLFADTTHHVFGACHAGRRGVENGVMLETLKMMGKKGAEPATTEIWIGPHICGDCYETGDEIAAAFETQFPGCSTVTRFSGRGIDMSAALLREISLSPWREATVHSDDPAMSEQTEKLWASISPDYQRRLINPAVNPQGMQHAGCTLENPLLYSYREWTKSQRPGCNGRFMNIIVPEPQL